MKPYLIQTILIWNSFLCVATKVPIIILQWIPKLLVREMIDSFNIESRGKHLPKEIIIIMKELRENCYVLHAVYMVKH